MARKKDLDWDLPEDNSWESIHAAILMDIRDELKRLNSLLHCSNFLQIPFTLSKIRKNTTKKKPGPKGKK